MDKRRRILLIAMLSLSGAFGLAYWDSQRSVTDNSSLASSRTSASPRSPASPSLSRQPSVVVARENSLGTPAPVPLRVQASGANLERPIAQIVDAGSPLREARVPLAFQDIPPQLAAANPQLAPAIEELQERFVNAVGGPNQNPSDPAYYKRWTAAQKNLDAEYRVLLGGQAFLVQQMKINNQ
jgi:hypothetical protein